MKPKNATIKNCISTSSDCVIWQGPEITCINLCPGDSITKVVYLLAKEICNLKAQLDITQFSLADMETEFGPVTDFKQIIENLITKAYA